MRIKGNQLPLIFLLGILLFLSGCIKDLTTTRILYQNDFEAGDLKGATAAGWLTDTQFGVFPFAKITQFQHQKVMGTFNNSSVNFSFNNLQPHTLVRVEFDLYLHDNWQNNLWIMKFDDQYRLITGFSNDSTIQQAYPNWYNNGSTSSAGNQAQEIYLPGMCSLKNSTRGTSVYRIVHSQVHYDSNFSLSLSDAGGAKNDTCTRSWSIDNIRIVTLAN